MNARRPPRHWTNLPPDARDDRSVAGILLRAARSLPTLTPDATARIQTTLTRTNRARGPAHLQPRWPTFALAAVALMIAGAAGASIGFFGVRPRSLPPAETQATPAAWKMRARTGVASRVAASALPVEPPRAAEPAPRTPALPGPSRAMLPGLGSVAGPRGPAARRVRGAAPPIVPAVPEVVSPSPAAVQEPSPAIPAVQQPVRSTLLTMPSSGTDPHPRPSLASAPAVESRILAQAIRKLRVDGDAAAALALLDEHRARFPRGELAVEALLSRVAALRLLDRTTEALALLDGAGLEVLPRGRELRVLRGELRALAGRCAEASTDFEQTLAEDPSGELGERALYGRASCRSRLGDREGARADGFLYLSRFPDGPYAARLRAALGR